MKKRQKNRQPLKENYKRLFPQVLNESAMLKSPPMRREANTSGIDKVSMKEHFIVN